METNEEKKIPVEEIDVVIKNENNDEKKCSKKKLILKWLAFGAAAITVGYVLGNDKCRKGLVSGTKKAGRKIKDTISGKKHEHKEDPKIEIAAEEIREVPVVPTVAVVSVESYPRKKDWNNRPNNNYERKERSNNWTSTSDRSFNNAKPNNN